jgi:hypothetical protein
MWSLAIEEQFYVLFPILLFLLRRVRKNTLKITLLSILLLSLALSVGGVFYFPMATFFLLPTRSWELLVGAVLALCLPVGKNPLSPLAANLCSFAGIALIGIPIFLYDRSTPFPGLTAVPPCLGCAAIIYSNTLTSTLVGGLLSKKPLVFVGLISYSLYLWHWPIFSGFRILYGIHIEVGTALLLAILLVLVAWLSWRFIETPFRLRRWGARRSAICSQVAFASLILFAISVVFWKTDGVSSRVSESLLADAKYKGLRYRSDSNEEYRSLGRKGTEIDFLLWGDSHAMAIAKSLDESAAKHQLVGRAAVKNSTPPLPGVWLAGHKEMLRRSEDVLGFFRTQKVRHLFLVARWSAYVEGGLEINLLPGEKSSDFLIVGHDQDEQCTMTATKRFAEALDLLAKEMAESNVKVWILRQVPEQNQLRLANAWMRVNLPLCGPLFEFEPPLVSIDQHRHRQANADRVMNAVAAKNKNLVILDGSPVFFGQGTNAIVIHEDHCLYRDNDHLSHSGAKLVVKAVFDNVFETIKSGNGHFVAERPHTNEVDKRR